MSQLAQGNSVCRGAVPFYGVTKLVAGTNIAPGAAGSSSVNWVHSPITYVLLTCARASTAAKLADARLREKLHTVRLEGRKT